MSPFDLPKLREQAKGYSEQMEAPGFWDDPDAAQKVNKQLKDVNDRIQQYEQLHDGVSDTLDLCEMVMAEYDDDMAKEIEKETESLDGRV